MSFFFDDDYDYGYEYDTDDNSIDYEEEDVDEVGDEDEISEENEVLCEDEDEDEDNEYELELEEDEVKFEEDESADDDVEDEEDEDYLPFYHPHARLSSSKRLKQKQESKTEIKSRKRKGKSTKKSSSTRPSKKRKVESTSKLPQTSQQSSMQNKKFSRQDKKSSKRSKKKKPHVKISAGAIRKFSAGYVKIPKDKRKWARKMATQHTKLIHDYFKPDKDDKDAKDAKDAREIFSHFEFTGSFYEHLKAQDADELDILVVLDTKNNAHLVVEEVKGIPGYARIKAAKGSKYWRPEFVNKKGYVDPVNIRNWFFGHIQRVINQYDKLKQEKDPELKVEDNGPARTLVIHDKENDRKLKMDLVPAFLFKPKKGSSPKAPALKAKTRYVPKPLPEDDELENHPKNELLWRQSFSFEEKKKMEKMDMKDKGCRREVIKVIKAIRERDKPLLKLKSYHIKTAFLHYNFGEGQENLDWSSKHLAERFLGLLDYLRKRISEKKLTHFFVSELNLLKEPEFSPSALDNIENRLSKLISNEKELKKALMQHGKKKRKR